MSVAYARAFVASRQIGVLQIFEVKEVAELARLATCRGKPSR